MAKHGSTDVSRANIHEISKHTSLKECEALLSAWRDDDGNSLLDRLQDTNGILDVAAARALLEETSVRASVNNSVAMILLTYMYHKKAHTGDTAEYFAKMDGFKEVADWSLSLRTNLNKWTQYKKIMLRGGPNVWDKFESVRGPKQARVFSLGYGTLQLLATCIDKAPSVEKVVECIQEGMAIRKYIQQYGEVPALSRARVLDDEEDLPAGVQSSEDYKVTQASIGAQNSEAGETEVPDAESTNDETIKPIAAKSTESSISVEDTMMLDVPLAGDTEVEPIEDTDQETGGVSLQRDSPGSPVTESVKSASVAGKSSAQDSPAARSMVSDDRGQEVGSAKAGDISTQRRLPLRGTLSTWDAKVECAKAYEPYLRKHSHKGPYFGISDLQYTLGKINPAAYQLEMHPPPKNTKRKLEEDTKQLNVDNDGLRDELEVLRARINVLRLRNTELEAENERLVGKVARLEVKVARLEDES